MRIAAVILLAALSLPHYHLTKTYNLPGTGSWDYLSYDAANKRVFVSRSTEVLAVDPKTGAITGTIPDTPGVHGAAIADDLNKGFTSNGREGSVTVFDLRTLQTLTKIGIPGKGPDAITYDAKTHRVFSMNRESDDVTIIDGTNNSVVATVPLPGGPEFATSDGQFLYVNIEDKNLIVKIDLTSNKVAATWPTAPCETPVGMAMDRDERSTTLLVSCRSKVMIFVNAANGKVMQSLPIGGGTDAAGYARGLGFSANGADGTLTVVREDRPGHYAVVENATTQYGARTMALDPKTREVYLVTADFGPPGTPNAQGFVRRPIVPGTVRLLVMSP